MEKFKVKVVDEVQVGPPPGSLPATISLPLTMFDIPFLITSSKYTFKNLFFYSYPHSLHHFTQTTIPLLKTSLSLTLQYFYPYVSNLILPPVPSQQKPRFLFAQGNSISFIVAECSGDFDYYVISSYHNVKEVGLLHSLAPNMPPAQVSPDGARVGALLAVQVTLFPNKGICIGTGMSHVVADGRAYHHFIKSWATICKSNGTQIDKFWMPSFDRDFIKDYEFESKLWKMWQDHDSCSQGADHDSLSYADKVQSDFVMKQCNVDKLKRYIANNYDNSSDGLDMNLSSFVVTCSFIWVCLIKSLEVGDDDNDYKVFRLGLPIDMRNQNNVIPATYFGNCVVGVFADVKRSELVAQNGLISAARAIRNCLKESKTNEPSKLMDNWIAALINPTKFGSTVSLLVAGSPNSKIYNKDFGWGFPNKVESLHLHLAPYTVSMTECKDEQGGIQISMELKRVEMDAFTRSFYQGLINSHL